MGTRSFLGVKRKGRGVDHRLPPSPEVKERVGLYIYSPSGSSWSVLGWTLPVLSYFLHNLYSVSDDHRHVLNYSWASILQRCFQFRFRVMLKYSAQQFLTKTEICAHHTETTKCSNLLVQILKCPNRQQTAVAVCRGFYRFNHVKYYIKLNNFSCPPRILKPLICQMQVGNVGPLNTKGHYSEPQKFSLIPVVTICTHRV